MVVLSDEQIRKVALDTALLAAPVFKANGWRWIYPDPPGVEEIADFIVERVTRMRDTGEYSIGCGHFIFYACQVGDATDWELYVSLNLATVWCGREDKTP